MNDSIGELFVEIRASFDKFSSDVDSGLKNLGKLSDQALQVGKTMSLALTAPLVAFGALSVKAFGEQEAATAKLQAVLKSTGSAAGKTADELLRMSTAFQKNTLYADEQILEGVTDKLLTFTRIQGDTFDRAQKAVVDLASSMNGDLQGAAIQVGKALQDPIAGLTALRRVGVAFDDQQKAMIKSMVESGNVAGAQAVILRELEKEFGGTAEAVAKVGSGPIVQLKNQFNDLQEQVGALMMKALIPLAKIASDVLSWFDRLSDGWKLAIVGVGALVAAIGPLLVAFGLLVPALTTAMTAIGGLAGAVALLTGPFGIATAAVVGLLAVMYKFPAARDVVNAVLKGIVEGLAMLGSTLKTVANTVMELASGNLSRAWDTIATSGGRFLDAGIEAADVFDGVMEKIGGTTTPAAAVAVTKLTGSIVAMNQAIKEGPLQGPSLGNLYLEDYLQNVKDLGYAAQITQAPVAGLNDLFRDQATVIEKLMALPRPMFNDFSQGTSDLIAGLALVPPEVEGVSKAFKRLHDGVVQAFSGITNSIVSGLDDILFKGKSWGETFLNIAKQTASNMFQAFLTGLLDPLTSALADIGRSISNVILGKSGGGILGGILGGGSAAGGAGAGSATAGGSSAGGGALGLLTNPWTIGVGAGILGATTWLKSQAHHEANTAVNTIENPFWASIGQIIPESIDAIGKLTPDQALLQRNALSGLNANYTNLITAFGTGGSDEATVARQSLANTQPYVQARLQALDAVIGSNRQSLGAATSIKPISVTLNVQGHLVNFTDATRQIAQELQRLVVNEGMVLS